MMVRTILFPIALILGSASAQASDLTVIDSSAISRFLVVSQSPSFDDIFQTENSYRKKNSSRCRKGTACKPSPRRPIRRS